MIFNRNLHVAVMFAAMMTLGARASLVSSNDVIGAVSAWSSVNGDALACNATPVCATPVCNDDGDVVLYWIVKMSNGGAVIASPDSDLDLVVAVIEKYEGSFPAGHPLPSMLKADMEKRLAVIAARNASSSAAAGGRRRGAGTSVAVKSASSPELDAEISRANAQWAKYGGGRAGGGMRLMGDSLAGGDASPYVRRIVDGFEQGGRYTHWNQGGNCYNRYTPNNAVCGCVATAGSAILQFFNWSQDIGNIVGNPTYGPSLAPASGFSNKYGPCNVTIAGAPDWSILPVEYGGANENISSLDDASRDLLGRVAYNMGVLLDMHWNESSSGSGASTYDLVEVFKRIGFTTARWAQYSGETNTVGTEFFKTLYAQVWCGAPVVLSIGGPPGGHAVVGCGYARDPDGDEFCRVFMGWGGGSDAWYKFPKVGEFVMVNGAVTMIGYEDDAVVPVYGEASLTGVDLVLPGYVTNGIPVTVPVNDNGFFGIRVPASITPATIEYNNQTWAIDPFDENVLTNTSASLAALDKAIPNEIKFRIYNMAVKGTMESAQAVAKRDGKALLMVSGTTGSPRTEALLDYLLWLDGETDISNRFVMVFNSAGSSDPNRPDGNPSIGVFDPADFEAGERWQEVNERLAYNDFIDQDASGEEGYLVYTFSETDTTAISNSVPALLNEGFGSYQRRRSDITVTITGANKSYGNNSPYEVTDVVPEYGVHTHQWTNGEVAVFSAPGAVTNGNVAVACVGWTTNRLFVGGELQPYNAGSTAEIQLHDGDDITLTWVWGPHYRVTARAQLSGGEEGPLGTVAPADIWVAAGERVTINALPTVIASRFSEWTVTGTVDYDRYSPADVSWNGTSVSFTVYEPVEAVAEYRDEDGSEPPAAPKEYKVTFLCSPEELQPFATIPLKGGLVWGENVTIDNTFVVDPSIYCVDGNSDIWDCVGWIGENVTQISGTSCRLDDTNVTVTLVYQKRPDPVGPVPDPISFIAIESAGVGAWTVTVSNAVKDCWYWLYSTDDLSKFAGDEAVWTAAAGLAATAEPNPQKAAADGSIQFHATGSGPKLFWRARATSKETGD